MMSKKLQRFIEATNQAYVASADHRARPHMAAGRGLKVPDAEHLVFEDWLCPRTIENISEVPRLAVAVVDAASGIGYQFSCRVEDTRETALADGMGPAEGAPGMPRVRWRVKMRVEEVMEFSTGPHSDHPMSELV